MKFTIERTAAREAIGKISSLIKRSQTIPVLSNFHIKASGGGIRITATDLNIQAATSAPAQVESEGVTTVAADKFAQIIDALADGSDLSFELEEGRAIVRSGRSRFVLPTLPAEDFPIMHPMVVGEVSHAFTIKTGAMARLIERGAFAMASDKGFALLNCAFLCCIDDGDGLMLRIVSTDKHSFGICDAPAPDGVAEGVCAMITPETIRLVHSIIKGVDGDLNVTITQGKIVFAMERIGIIAKQLAGTYVEYQRVIPKPPFAQVVTVDTDMITGLIRRAAIMSSGLDGAVRLNLAAGTISAAAKDGQTGGEAEDCIDCELVGEPTNIRMSARACLDILALVETENVVISFPADVKKGSPVVFEPTGDSDWFALRGSQVG